MKKTVIAATAALVAGGVLFAGQAAASPTTPAPTPTASTSPGSAAQGAGVGWFYRALTDVQRECLADAKLQRPKGKLTEDQRTTLAKQVRDALSGCAVTLPEKVTNRPRLGFAWAALTAEQQQCLANTKLTRPLGKLTDAQRAAVKQSVKDAVAACR